jgi:hypothetical protein
MRKKILLTLTVLALASLTALAANKDGIVTTKDGRMTIATKPTKSVTRTEPNDPSLVKIVDNIGTAYPKGKYWCCEGSTITGPTAISGFPEFWTAAAFTPTANHTITKIEVAVGYVEGTNGLILALYNDASGVPGTPIKAFAVSGLPNFGSCCKVVSATDNAGITVTAGTQYWVVMKTGKKTSNTYAAWNLNDTDQVDSVTFAQYCSDDKGGTCGTNDKWTAFTTTTGPAFAVLGK